MRQAILLVAYGAGTQQGRRELEMFDARVRGSFPGFAVRWAYSSSLLRQRLASKKLKSDSVSKALHKLWFERYFYVAVQPLWTIAGREYEEMLQVIDTVSQERGMQIEVGFPLLFRMCDVQQVAQSLATHLPGERKSGEHVIYMGHGSKHAASMRYAELNTIVESIDAAVHVGTMEGVINLTTLLPKLTSKRIFLLPLLSTVGRHTVRDMAGRQCSSWRCVLEAAGHEVHAVLKGTVEHSAIADIWLDHLSCAVDNVLTKSRVHGP